MFYLTMHSTHFILWLYGVRHMVKDHSDSERGEETCCRHIGYSFQLAARVLLYASSHRQDNTYHSLWYTSRGALGGTRNSSMGPPHEGSIRRPIAPWANALPLIYVPLPPTSWRQSLVALLEVNKPSNYHIKNNYKIKKKSKYWHYNKLDYWFIFEILCHIWLNQF